MMTFFACDQQNYILHLKELSEWTLLFNVCGVRVRLESKYGQPYAFYPKFISAVGDGSLQEYHCCRARWFGLLVRSLSMVFILSFHLSVQTIWKDHWTLGTWGQHSVIPSVAPCLISLSLWSLLSSAWKKDKENLSLWNQGGFLIAQIGLWNLWLYFTWGFSHVLKSWVWIHIFPHFWPGSPTVFYSMLDRVGTCMRCFCLCCFLPGENMESEGEVFAMLEIPTN